MASELQIANEALSLLGEGLITSGQLATPDDKKSRTVATFLAASRKAVLRDIAPNCARKYDDLVETPPTQPDHPDHLYLFDLPTDCLRVVTVFSAASGVVAGRGAPVVERWRILSGKKLAADELGLAIQYVYDAPTTVFDSLLDEALAAHLAMKMAVPLTESNTKRQQMAELYESFKAQAKGTDEMEGPRDRYDDATRLTSARFGRRLGNF